MIYGTIGTNPESATYKLFNPNKTTPNYGSHYYEDLSYYSPSKTENLKEELDRLIKEGAILGFIQNARVKRASGLGNPGTITKINFFVCEAYNKNNYTLEPYKVKWDPLNTDKQQVTFNYTEEELVLIPNKNSPVPIASPLLSANQLGAF